MLLTDWLARLKANELYPDPLLEELEQFGIRYRDGMLTSIRTDETPYPSFGRCTEVHRMSQRELAQAALQMRRRLVLDEPESDTLLTPGYEVVTACWRLLRPITTGPTPPSSVATTAAERMLFDLEALRRYGY